jgi:protein TonB
MSIISTARLELFAYFNPEEFSRLKKIEQKWFKFFWIFLLVALAVHGLFFAANLLKNLSLGDRSPPPLSIEIVAPKGGAADAGIKKPPAEVKEPPKEQAPISKSDEAKSIQKPVEQAIPQTSAADKSAATVDSDKYADYLKNPKPSYPMGPYRAGIEGTVWLRVQVLEDGGVGAVEIAQSSGNDELDQSALNTVKKWRFNAAVQGGKTAAQWVRIPITFKLRNR